MKLPDKEDKYKDLHDSKSINKYNYNLEKFFEDYSEDDFKKFQKLIYDSVAIPSSAMEQFVLGDVPDVPVKIEMRPVHWDILVFMLKHSRHHNLNTPDNQVVVFQKRELKYKKNIKDRKTSYEYRLAVGQIHNVENSQDIFEDVTVHDFLNVSWDAPYFRVEVHEIPTYVNGTSQPTNYFDLDDLIYLDLIEDTAYDELPAEIFDDVSDDVTLFKLTDKAISLLLETHRHLFHIHTND